MTRRSSFLASLFCAGFLTAPALHADQVNTERLAAIKPALQKFVDNKQTAGIVTLVMQNGKVLHHEAVGYADLAANKPMRKDSVFWIASMTKSINATAVMVLVDDGRLSLDEPASKWMKELGEVKLGSGQPPARPITLRDLLSHTAGIAFPRRAPSDGAVSLKNYAVSLVKTPLAFEPGSAYQYGFGPTVAGRIVELVSGMKYQDFLTQRIFQPLGMNDTMFNPDDARRARFAKTYKLNDDKEIEAAYNPFITPEASITHMVEPSGGLFSTAADMGRFYSMVANGGELDGRRILTAQSVAEMTRHHSAGGKPIAYGLGWQCNLETQRTTPSLPPATFGHGGAFGTSGFIDPESKIVTVFMLQSVLFPGGNSRNAFHDLVMDAAGIKVPQPVVSKTGK